MYIYSPSLHQDLYQNLIVRSYNYLPIHIIPNNLNEEYIDLKIEEVIKIKDFEKSDCELETFVNTDELKFPQEYDDGGIIILDDLNEKEMNDPRVKAMFKRSRDKNLSIFFFIKITTNFPKRRLELLEKYTTYSNQTVS